MTADRTVEDVLADLFCEKARTKEYRLARLAEMVKAALTAAGFRIVRVPEGSGIEHGDELNLVGYISKSEWFGLAAEATSVWQTPVFRVKPNTKPCPSGHTDCTVDCGWCKGTGRVKSNG